MWTIWVRFARTDVFEMHLFSLQNSTLKRAKGPKEPQDLAETEAQFDLTLHYCSMQGPVLAGLGALSVLPAAEGSWGLILATSKPPLLASLSLPTPDSPGTVL